MKDSSARLLDTATARPWLTVALGLIVGLVAAWQPAYAAAAVVLLLVGVAGFAWPAVLVGLVFAVVVLAAVAETGVEVGSLPVTPSKVVVAGGLGLWMAHSAASGKRMLRWHPVLTCMIAMVASMGISLAAAGWYTQRTVHQVIPFVSFIVLVGLVHSALEGVRLQPLLRSIAIVTVAALAVSLVPTAGPGEVEAARASGTLGDPNTFAAFVLLLSPLALGGLIDDEHWSARPLILLLILLAPISIVRTISRTALLTLLLISPVYLYMLRRRKPEISLGILGGAVLLPFVTDLERVKARYFALIEAARGGVRAGDASIQERYALQQQAIDAFSSHPFLGIGPGNFGRNTTILGVSGLPKVAHNTYLQMAADQGMLGVLTAGLLVIVVVRMLVDAFRNASTARDRHRLLGVTAGLAGFAAMAVTLSLLNTPLVWLVVGLATAIASRAASRSR